VHQNDGVRPEEMRTFTQRQSSEPLLAKLDGTVASTDLLQQLTTGLGPLRRFAAAQQRAFK
jgi:hypothetical protein